MSEDLPSGWYTADDGSRRFWTGSEWVVPDVGAGKDQASTPVRNGRARTRMSKRAKILLAVGAGVLILGGGGAAVAATSISTAQAEARHVAAVRHAKELADQRAAAAAAARAEKEASDAAERDSRASLISSLQKSVEKTAKKDVSDGLLTGPILDVSCTPLGGGSTDDLTQKTATLQCFAANKKNGDGTENGYEFKATMNWDSGEYTWQLGS